jgi:hypothetical protein
MLRDLKALFASLAKNDVRYVVIGGIAAVLHGVPRATFDIDLLIEATTENVERLLKSMLEAGFATADLTTAADVCRAEITIFPDRIRVDVLTVAPGINFLGAWQSKETVNFEGQDFYVLSKNDLIISKQAAGRPVDLDDVRALTQSEE